jgi:hypothetical protein
MATILDELSPFLEDCGIFGRYPKPDEALFLHTLGITRFIDLTTPEESLPPYLPAELRSLHQSYPIPDRMAPSNRHEFRRFIAILVERLRQGEKLYIHCRGGHGRSGLVVSCILMAYYGLSASDALRLTWQYHQARPVMDPRMRRLGSPQTQRQKRYVQEFIP